MLRSLFDRLHDRRRPDGGLAVPVEEEHDADGHDVGEEDDDRVRGGDCDLVQSARARARVRSLVVEDMGVGVGIGVLH